MHRRRFATSIALAGIASPLAVAGTVARQPGTPGATPVATPVANDPPTFADRVALIEPETLLQTLRTTPVTTVLLRADTPLAAPEVWDDFGDTDLTNTLGGVVFNTGFDENENFQGIGVAIVHPDAASAEASLAADGPDLQPFLGLPWIVEGGEDSAVSVLGIAYLILAGGADLSVFPDEEPGRLAFRAVAHMTALLDHLDMVLTALGE